MNVSLGDAFETYVRELVSTGRYNNASEVIREALRLKMQQDEERAAQLDALRRDVEHARAQVRRGDVVETSHAELTRRPRRRNG
jgi:antitoxin ParD1/3/4